MSEMTTDEMIENFINNGLDLEYFKFLSEYDKENFFMMYKDLFQSLMKEEDEYDFVFTSNYDLTVSLNGESAFFYMTDEYKTLKCDLDLGFYDKENTNQVLILTILFLTVKELKAMIDMFAEEILSNMKNKKSGKLTKLPNSFNGKANYISSMQDGIMDDIEEARNKITVKEIK